MNSLADAAQLITYYELTRSYGWDQAQSEEARTNCAAKAAAAANYLFGKDPDPRHIEQFNLGQLKAETREWLKSCEPFHQLVVQSLHVRNTVAYGTDGKASASCESVLSSLGEDDPNAPDPQSFEKLIRRMADTLTTAQRERIRPWLPK